MGKVVKQGKLCVVLRGRFAGRKAVIVKSFDEKSRVLIAGLDKAPQKVTRSMSKKKVSKRARVRPFVKMVNHNHVLVTRYTADFTLKQIDLPATKDANGEATEPVQVSIDEESVKDEAGRALAKRAAKQVFQEAFFAQDKRKNAKAQEGVQFFFQKLKF